MSKIAFVCSGGGAKGCVEAGAMKRVLENGVTPEAVYGTSVGALNACGYSYLGMEGLEKLWRGIRGRSDVLFPSGLSWIWGWPRVFYASGIYHTRALRTLINTAIAAGKPRCKAVACYVDLTSGSTNYVDNSRLEFADAVHASTAIPLIMESVGLKVDGGAREQTPLTKAIEDGYTEIYVFLANPLVKDPKGGWKLPSSWFKWFHIFKRTVDDIMCHEIFITDLMRWVRKSANNCCCHNNLTLHVFAPEHQIMDTLDFDPKKIAYGFQKGYESRELNLDAYR